MGHLRIGTQTRRKYSKKLGKNDTERWTMSQAVKLPRSCLLGLLIIPLTYYYISMYSYSSCDTFEDYQMGNFVQEVCISVFQIQKKMNMTLKELPSKISLQF